MMKNEACKHPAATGNVIVTDNLPGMGNCVVTEAASRHNG